LGLLVRGLCLFVGKGKSEGEGAVEDLMEWGRRTRKLEMYQCVYSEARMIEMEREREREEREREKERERKEKGVRRKGVK